MLDNLPLGADWYLRMQERDADAYDAALEKAWQALYEWAPEGVGWDVVSDEQDRDAVFVFHFADAGGYEYTARINLWGDDE